MHFGFVWLLPNVFNQLMLRKHGITTKVKTYGLIHFKISKNASLKIGAGSIICSHWRRNSAGGGQRKCIISVNNGAILDIGENVGISNSTIYCRDHITIEDNVLIGVNCTIYDTDFHSLNYDLRVKGIDHGKHSPVIIKEGAWIGGHCIILKGVTIGKHSVIGAGSVVTKNIPDSELWAGNPACFIKKLE